MKLICDAENCRGGWHALDGGPCPAMEEFMEFLEDVAEKRGPFMMDNYEHAISCLEDHAANAKIWKERFNV